MAKKRAPKVEWHGTTAEPERFGVFSIGSEKYVVPRWMSPFHIEAVQKLLRKRRYGDAIQYLKEFKPAPIKMSEYQRRIKGRQKDLDTIVKRKQTQMRQTRLFGEGIGHVSKILCENMRRNSTDC